MTIGDYRKYVCVVCGYIYDEAEGDAEGGLPPGTRFEDIPDDWVCPECGASKEDFELLEE
jgi:rubredoxin-NAD+ reductase